MQHWTLGDSGQFGWNAHMQKKISSNKYVFVLYKAFKSTFPKHIHGVCVSVCLCGVPFIYRQNNKLHISNERWWLNTSTCLAPFPSCHTAMPFFSFFLITQLVEREREREATISDVPSCEGYIFYLSSFLASFSSLIHSCRLPISPSPCERCHSQYLFWPRCGFLVFFLFQIIRLHSLLLLLSLIQTFFLFLPLFALFHSKTKCERERKNKIQQTVNLCFALSFLFVWLIFFVQVCIPLVWALSRRVSDVHYL